MKANSLSICVPVPEDSRKVSETFCNKNCPYCVSKMTGYGEVNEDLFYAKIHKVKHLAEMSQVSSIIFTGKSEPLLNMKVLRDLGHEFRDFPLEVQTNGILLTEGLIAKLALYNFDTIAISIDSPKQLGEMLKKVPIIKAFGMTTRLTINLTPEIVGDPEDKEKVQRLLDLLQEKGVDQISLRSIVIPNNAIDTPESIEAQKWIRENIKQGRANAFMEEYQRILERQGIKVREIKTGVWQLPIYMYKGMSCMSFPYCVQDLNSNEDIRSLVYYEDGHLSTTWYGSNHGRIF